MYICEAAAAAAVRVVSSSELVTWCDNFFGDREVISATIKMSLRFLADAEMSPPPRARVSEVLIFLFFFKKKEQERKKRPDYLCEQRWRSCPAVYAHFDLGFANFSGAQSEPCCIAAVIFCLKKHSRPNLQRSHIRPPFQISNFHLRLQRSGLA